MSANGLSSSASVDAMPAEIRGWNWGAFLLNWIWGISHRTYIALLVFVPFVGLVVPFVLGAKGNAWAWQNGHWQSVAHFKAVQRRWGLWALAVYAAFAALCVAGWLAFNAMMKESEVYALTTSMVQADPRVIEAIGQPMEFGNVAGSIRVSGPDGEASYAVPVSGPKASGKVYVSATKAMDRWSIAQLVVEPEGAMPIDVARREPVPQPSAASP